MAKSPYDDGATWGSSRAAVVGAFMVAVLIAGAVFASRSGDSSRHDAGSPPASVTVPPTTTEPPNRAPTVRTYPATIRAVVGRAATARVVAHDLDGRVIDVSIMGPPPGLRTGDRRGRLGGLTWRPSEPGRWEMEVAVTDDDGARSTASVVFEARYPARPGLLVGMGDSVAAGHGLDRSDYLGRDGCWRDEDDAYPRRAFDALAAAGQLAGDPAFALVACSGARVADLSTELVGGGPSDLVPPAGDARSQLDWVVRANPGIVTLTIGANDLGFAEPWELVDDGSLDRSVLAPRLDRLRDELAAVVDRLVDATDATVAITTYYDPSSRNPQGIDGCREACFVAVTREALDELNAAITAAAVPHIGSARVVSVDLRAPFVGHGAPNGFGPDGLREGGFGLFGDLLGSVTRGTHPYCARGDTVDDPWVNSLDCVHPTDEGTEQIAALVVQALTEASAIA